MRPTVLRTPELAAAHTDVEKARLPGIRRAEAENEAEELKRVKSADGKLGTAPRVESSAPPAKAEASVERDSKGFYPVPE
jgi:hypothetical protein